MEMEGDSRKADKTEREKELRKDRKIQKRRKNESKKGRKKWIYRNNQSDKDERNGERQNRSRKIGV